ncbi:MAG: DUF3575 domain-containing protein [Alistipes sp.]|nr:DUF3575 domain-containing protein [Alistipes sp.]
MNKSGQIILLLLLLIPFTVAGQTIAVKTNMPYWATTTPNISVEWAPSYKVSLELQGSYSGWKHLGNPDANRKLRHWLVRPQVRFWIYEAFDGHFLGIHPFYGEYNFSNLKLPLSIFKELDDNRYQGYGTGLGFSYGYQWYMGRHWNLELEFGFSYAYLNYDRYHSAECSPCLGHHHKHYFGPTKLGVSIVYLFRNKKR